MLNFEMAREIVPCLYELSYIKGDPPILRISIHNEFLDANKGRAPVHPLLEKMKEEHNFNEFLPFGNDYFGFDKALKKGKIKDEFTEFDIEIPKFKMETGETCKHCGGEGFDKYLGLPCSWCDGSKHETIYNWKPFLAIGASLELFTSMAEIFDKKTSAKIHQLLSFQPVCRNHNGASPMGGSFGIDFCSWLTTFPDMHQFSQAIQAMAEVHAHIYQKEIDFYDIEAYVGEGAWLIIDCPGDACGILADDDDWEPGQGRNFSCHNLDNLIQQTELLIALAELSGEARREI